MSIDTAIALRASLEAVLSDFAKSDLDASLDFEVRIRYEFSPNTFSFLYKAIERNGIPCQISIMGGEMFNTLLKNTDNTKWFSQFSPKYTEEGYRGVYTNEVYIYDSVGNIVPESKEVYFLTSPDLLISGGKINSSGIVRAKGVFFS